MSVSADELVRRYLLLGLRLGRHVDGLVDSYYGPAELRDEADVGEPAGPRGLAAEAGALLDALPGAGLANEQRERWLSAQLVGLETVARVLAGDEIGYVEEVERCYGLRLERIPGGALRGRAPRAGRGASAR